MNRLDDIRLGDIVRALRRYQPFIGVVVAIALLMAFLPGEASQTGQDEDIAALLEGTGTDAPGVTGSGSATATTVAGDAPTVDESGAPLAADTGGDVGTGGDAGVAPSGDTGGGGVEGGDAGAPEAGTGAGDALPPPPQVGADCDTARGRIKVPTSFAPPCMPPFSGDNGGATAQGVTATEIIVVDYDPKSDPATDAALTAAGANNTPPQQKATSDAYVDYFNKHYNLYGRQVKLVHYDGSGESDDDAAAKADAIDIATRIKPFAVWGSNNVAFVTEMAKRKIICVCTTSQPQELYAGLAPYVGYTTLMSSTQGYIHRAEYVGKRLAGRPAKHAGTSDALPMATKKREFGLLYFETADNAYKSGADFFEKELAKYGVKLKVRLAYTGPPNLATTQEQSRPFIAKLKQSGVTSVLFAGDPISPAIFTREATNQRYFPEWIITGSALTDTTIFARTFDQAQWDKAFGISFLNARYPREQADAYKVHVWHHGAPPVADNQYAVIYNEGPFPVFTGLHMAGPNLTAASWVKGMFSYPPTGAGKVTSAHMSFGDHGIWPFTDFTQLDDVTEIWWDPRATGEDEVGNPGVGMYRYVDGGKRYLPGKHPKSEPRVFDPNGSPTYYNERPAAERPPDYPHEHK